MKKQKPTIEEAIPALLLNIVCECAFSDALKQNEAMHIPNRSDVLDAGAMEARALRLLMARMEWLFQHNDSFRRGVLRKGSGGCAGRDYLRTFAAHWAQSLLDARSFAVAGKRGLWRYEESGLGLLFLSDEFRDEIQRKIFAK